MAWGAMAGKGAKAAKANGKGASRQAAASTPKSGPGARTKVVSARVVGTVAEWKGKFGWITTTQKINHPQASLKNGRIYFAAQDVAEELSGIGAKVSFFVYADGTGLGAMNVRPHSGAIPVQKTIEKKSKFEMNSTAKVQGKASKNTPGKPKTALGKFATAVKGSADKAKDPEKVQPAPDKAERKALTFALSGAIARWKGQVGWIQPDKAIEHPLAANLKKGHLYVHQVDVVGGKALEVGSKVKFSLYSDAQGLGASNVKLVGGASASSSSPFTGVAKPSPFGAAQTKPATGLQYANGKGPGKPTGLQYANGKAPGKSDFMTPKPKAAAGKPVLKPVLKANAKAAPTMPGKAVVQPSPQQKAAGRQRLPGGMILGKVVDLKDKFGWITPNKPIAHLKASAHQGRIYLGKDDFVEGELVIGSTVKFFCYADSSGLGAEQCRSV